MVTVACITVLVVVFAWSSASKLTAAGFGALRSMLAQLRLRRVATPVGVAIVGTEISVVVLLLYPPTVAIGAMMATVVMVILAAGVASLLRRGLAVRCACFGRNMVVLNPWHLARNIVLLMVSMAVLMATWTTAAVSVSLADLAVAVVIGAVLALILVRIEDVAYLVQV